MQHFLPLLLISVTLAANAFADTQSSEATVDKTGVFRGVGTVHDPRAEPASNGDLQAVRWDAHDGYERLVFDLHENSYDAKKSPPLQTPGRYDITNEIYPCRVVCDLSARQASGLLPPPDLAKSRLIRGIHQITVLDDSVVKFALEMSRPVEIEVFELHDPARIVIDIRAAAGTKKRYSVRTPGIGGGEAIGILDETVSGKGFSTRTLRCADGSFCIEAGLFATREEATALAGKLAGAGITVLVEERGINDPPAAPESP